MKYPKTPRNRSSGDTIVEVLVAIAIVGAVLAGAYTSTRRSANATRTAQEQGEALKLAESQVEQIKIAIDANTPNVTGAGNFCITGATLAASCVTGTGVVYTTVVTHSAGSRDFVVNVTWPGLSGITNNVELDYSTK